MEVLSPLDAAFLRLENDDASMHIGSVAVFEGPAPTQSEIVRAFAAKLPLVPRYRQRVQEAPLHLGRPLWVDDAHFSLRYHLRRTAVPQPGGWTQLRDLVGRVMSNQLDRRKPLWETWVVEGLAGGRWALVSKIHHCMVDGIAGTDLLALVLDATPAAHVPEPLPWRPEQPPSPWQLLANAARSVPQLPTSVAGAVAGTVAAPVRHPRQTAQQAGTLARGLAEYARLARPAPASSLSGPIGPHRAWACTITTFEDLRAVRQACGGTVNDVVLAAVTAGFRALLLARGERPDAHAVRTLIPVSVRHEDQHGQCDNRVSAMVADLPVQLDDPEERLRAVRTELDRLKQSGEAQLGELLTELSVLVPPLLLDVGLTAAFRVPHRNLVTVATNVPGPRTPLYLLGRRMQEYHPYVPIADRVRIGVAMTSYDGTFSFGVTADADAAPDVDVLVDGIRAGMDELVALAQQSATA